MRHLADSPGVHDVPSIELHHFFKTNGEDVSRLTSLICNQAPKTDVEMQPPSNGAPASSPRSAMETSARAHRVHFLRFRFDRAEAEGKTHERDTITLHWLSIQAS